MADRASPSDPPDASSAIDAGGVPAGWDPADPGTWTLETAVDAPLGVDPGGGAARARRAVRTAARDYAVAGDPAPAEVGWWAGVLVPIHAARVAVARAAPGALARAGAALGLAPDQDFAAYWAAHAGDLEEEAAAARRILAALGER